MATVAERIELLHNNLAHVEAMGGEKKVEISEPLTPSLMAEVGLL